jgi:hypothetical protein
MSIAPRRITGRAVDGINRILFAEDSIANQQLAQAIPKGIRIWYRYGSH